MDDSTINDLAQALDNCNAAVKHCVLQLHITGDQWWAAQATYAAGMSTAIGEILNCLEVGNRIAEVFGNGEPFNPYGTARHTDNTEIGMAFIGGTQGIGDS